MDYIKGFKEVSKFYYTINAYGQSNMIIMYLLMKLIIFAATPTRHGNTYGKSQKNGVLNAEYLLAGRARNPPVSDPCSSEGLNK